LNAFPDILRVVPSFDALQKWLRRRAENLSGDIARPVFDVSLWLDRSKARLEVGLNFLNEVDELSNTELPFFDLLMGKIGSAHGTAFSHPMGDIIEYVLGNPLQL